MEICVLKDSIIHEKLCYQLRLAALKKPPKLLFKMLDDCMYVY